MGRSLKSLLVFLLSSSCFGQLPVIPFVVQNNATPIPLQIPGLALWWVATDNWTTNAPATNWIDRVQGVIAKPVANRVPTNSALGMGFDNTPHQFTNVHTLIGTNFTAITFFRQTANGNSYQNYWGENGSNWLVGADNQAAGNVRHAYYAPTGPSSFDGAFPGRSNEYDFAIAVSNTASSHNVYAWTNGQFVAVSGAVTENRFFGSIGANDGLSGAFSGYWFLGYIREVLVYTNHILTGPELALIHQYRTNLYGGTP